MNRKYKIGQRLSTMNDTFIVEIISLEQYKNNGTSYLCKVLLENGSGHGVGKIDFWDCDILYWKVLINQDRPK